MAQKVSRRNYVKYAAAGVVVVAGAAAGAYYASRPGPAPIVPTTTATTTGAPSKSIVFATWGGAWQQGVIDALKGFEQANNCKIEYFIQSDSAETVVKEIAEKDHPTIDIIMTGPANTMTGIAGGVAEPIDPDLVPNLKDIVPAANLVVDGKVYNPGLCFNFMGIAVRSDRIDISKVTSWKWMWSKDLFPKKLGVPTPAYYGQPIQTSYAWFGDQYHVDEAFNKLKELAPNIGLTYVDDAVASEALAGGEIDALQCYNIVAYKMFKEKAPVKFILPANEPFWLYPNGPMVVKNAPAGKDLQMKLINWMLTPEAVTKYCAALAVNPSNVKSEMPSDPTLAPFLLTEETMAAVPIIDFPFLSQNTDKWQERWDKEIKPLLG